MIVLRLSPRALAAVAQVTTEEVRAAVRRLAPAMRRETPVVPTELLILLWAVWWIRQNQKRSR